MKVYVTVPVADVLITDGFQVPVMLLSDVVGSAGALLFKQYGPKAGNVGVTWLVIVISMFTGCAHGSSGVNV